MLYEAILYNLASLIEESEYHLVSYPALLNQTFRADQCSDQEWQVRMICLFVCFDKNVIFFPNFSQARQKKTEGYTVNHPVYEHNWDQNFHY